MADVAGSNTKRTKEMGKDIWDKELSPARKMIENTHKSVTRFTKK
jgi:hypothetical protein